MKVPSKWHFQMLAYSLCDGLSAGAAVNQLWLYYNDKIMKFRMKMKSSFFYSRFVCEIVIMVFVFVLKIHVALFSYPPRTHLHVSFFIQCVCHCAAESDRTNGQSCHLKLTIIKRKYAIVKRHNILQRIKMHFICDCARYSMDRCIA